MRHLRALFNIAIKRKVMNKNNYPFNDYKVSKLKPESNKRALSVDEFKKIKEVEEKDQKNELTKFMEEFEKEYNPSYDYLLKYKDRKVIIIEFINIIITSTISEKIFKFTIPSLLYIIIHYLLP